VIDLLQGSETELNAHPFLLELQKAHVNLVTRARRDEPKVVDIYDYIANSFSFSADEKFTLETALLIQEMHFKIDKVQQSVYMLDFYPTDIRVAWATPLTEGEYISNILWSCMLYTRWV
jgi:hypothetical protein